jgi:SpoIVB peptidase S55
MKQLQPLRFRWVVAAVALPFFALPFLLGQADVQFFPLSEVQPGLKGVGRTVFEGDKIEEFQVEVLGVLKNAIGPKHDVILARLSGGPLERTGVIQGMSGSPVYIDGKLLGAVALSFPFSKEPVAGITPIEEMLEVVPEPAPTGPAALATRMNYHIARVATDPLDGGRLIPEPDDAAAVLSKLPPSQGEESTVSSLRLPLRFGGFSSETIQTYTPLFRQMGFEPLEGGTLSGGESTPPITAGVEPGSMISLLLVRGDLNLNGDCTVTYLRGNNLYACGHRIFLMGPAQIPFAQSRVLGTVPSLAMSFKLDAPGPPVGTIRQDRFGAIYGEVGDVAPLIPVHIRVDSTLNRKADYNFEMVQETFLSPLLLNLGVVSTLTATERMLGPSTVEVKGNIRLSGGEVVDLEDVVSSDMNTPGAAGAAVSLPLAYLLASGFLDMRVEGIDLSIVSRNEKRVATLDQVWSTESEVHPGGHIEVTALLRTPSGETAIQKIPVTIPESVRDKTLSVVVGSGPTLNALQSGFNPLTAVPRDLPHLVRNLNRMRRNDRLYALLMAPQRSFILQGDEYPSPPPSLVQTFLADPAASSSVMFSGSSVIGDFETKSSPYSIRGQKTLLLKVVGAGS